MERISVVLWLGRALLVAGLFLGVIAQSAAPVVEAASHAEYADYTAR
ncbi:MAG: hypothetical protein U0893_24550 [Chloroflexota bacterium]